MLSAGRAAIILAGKLGLCTRNVARLNGVQSHSSEHLHVSFLCHGFHINSAQTGQKPPQASVKTLFRLRDVSNFDILVNYLL